MEYLNKHNIRYYILKKKRDIIFWLIGIFLILLIFLVISSKDFSFLLTLSSIIQCLSFIIIIIKVKFFQNTSGLSINTFYCYSILLISRLMSTCFFDGYLPSDSSGDWFYQFVDFSSFIFSIYIIYLITFCYKETSDIKNDNINLKYLIFPSFILAIFFHNNFNQFLICDISWTFSMYLETVVIYPQLYLFIKKGGQIESYTSHYVALCGLSRLFSLIFWWCTFPELNEGIKVRSEGFFNNYMGYAIIFSQILQLIIMIDYYYLYFKSLIKGIQMNTFDI